MARLALGIVGAGVGSLGGPFGAQLGFALGSALGGALFPDPGQNQTTEGSRLADLAVTSSTVGMALPLIEGTYKVGGNIIYSPGLVESRSETSQRSGGKGGGGGSTVTSVTYSYTATMAVSLGEGTLTDVLKISFMDEVLYDASVDAALPSYITFYDGSESQTVDPVIEAALGVGNVPAFRGTSYLLFDTVDVTAWGQIPNITVTVSNSTEPFLPDAAAALGITVINQGAHFTSGSNTTQAYYLDTLGLLRSVGEDLAIADVSIPASSFISRGMTSLFWSDVQGPTDGGVLLVGSNNPSSSDKSGGFLWYDPSTGDTGEIIYDGIGVNPQDRSSETVLITYADGKIFRTTGIFTIAGEWHTSLWVNNLIGSIPPGETNVPQANGRFDDIPGYIGAIDAYNGILQVSHQDANTGDFSHVVYDQTGITAPWFGEVSRTLKTTEVLVIRNDDVDTFLLFDDRIERVELLSGTVLQTYPMPEVMKDFQVKNGIIYATRTTTASVYEVSVSSGGLIGDESLLVTGVTGYTEGSGSYAVPTSYGMGYYLIHSSGANDFFVRAQKTTNSALDVPLSAVVATVCEKAGVTYDVSELTDTLRGYAMSGRVALSSHLDALSTVYQFGIADGDPLRFVKYGASSAVTIPEGLLAAAPIGSVVPRVVQERVEENGLPRTLTFSYADFNREYEPVSAPAFRYVTASNAEVAEGFSLSTDNTDMSDRVLRSLYHRWASRRGFTIDVPWDYIAYEPTDVISFESKGVTETARVVQADLGSNAIMRLTCVSTNQSVYSLTAASLGNITTSPAPLVSNSPTVLRTLDLPLLLDIDDFPGYYLSATAIDDTNTTTWSGARIYRSLDNANYNTLIDVAARGTFGTAGTILAAPVYADLFDYANTLEVTLLSGTLESITEEAVLAGGNAAALGNDATGYEIIQFSTATLTGALTYTLSGLLRGRKGTEWRMGSHVASEQFTLLTTQSIFRIDDSLTNAGATVYFKPVTVGDDITTAVAQSFVDNLVSLKPYSTVDLAGSLDINNNWVLTWTRRARTDNGWNNNTDVPLDEVIESYDVEIMDGATVVRTVTVDENTVIQANLNLAVASFTYDEAMQLADFGAVQSTVTFRVYQNSATVGRGYVTEAVV